MLFDTDILIWLLRGNNKAARLIDQTPKRYISVVNFMELLQGAKDRREVKIIKSVLSDFSFQVLPLTENIGHRAAIYVEEYALKSGLYMPDALIAATAIENNLALASANQKHYRVIKELELKIFISNFERT